MLELNLFTKQIYLKILSSIEKIKTKTRNLDTHEHTCCCLCRKLMCLDYLHSHHHSGTLQILFNKVKIYNNIT